MAGLYLWGLVFFFLNNMGRVWLSGWFFLVGRVKMDRVKRGSVFSGSGYVFSKEKTRLWVTFAGWGCWFGGVTCDRGLLVGYGGVTQGR
jgi:hypothetical protein